MIVNEQFGLWTVIGDLDSKKPLCRCMCGTIRNVRKKNLVAGLTSSCGCLYRARPKQTTSPKLIHGMTDTPTWRSWMSMHRRAGKHHRYLDVKIHPPWSEFLNFLADMGARPEGTSLDRYPDPYGNYEPTNCRWATPTEQQNNRREEFNCQRCKQPMKGHSYVGRVWRCP